MPHRWVARVRADQFILNGLQDAESAEGAGGMNAAQPWQQGLENLRHQGILAGYALVTKDGLCDTAQGLLNHSLGRISLEALLNSAGDVSLILDSAQQASALTLLGHKLIVYKQTLCDVYAISRRKTIGVCFNNLPFGLLISVFERPQLPQTVVPMLEVTCSCLRA